MSIDSILILLLVLMALVIIIGIVVLWILGIRLSKKGRKLIGSWHEIMELKESNPNEFCQQCFTILDYLGEHWEKFAVAPSIHDKGYMVVGKNSLGQLKFWPSQYIHGSEHKPTYYLTTDDEARKLMLDVIENLCKREMDYAYERKILESLKEDDIHI